MPWVTINGAHVLIGADSGKPQKLKGTPTTKEFVEHTTRLGSHVQLTAQGQARVNSFKNSAADDYRTLKQEHMVSIAGRKQVFVREKTSPKRKARVEDLASGARRDLDLYHAQHRQDVQALKLKTTMNFGTLLKNLHQEGHVKLR
jgi:DNA-binding transcriptional regulator YhcF (GntR family)